MWHYMKAAFFIIFLYKLDFKIEYTFRRLKNIYTNILYKLKLIMGCAHVLGYAYGYHLDVSRSPFPAVVAGCFHHVACCIDKCEL